MKILSNESRNSRKGPKEWFTGAAWIEEIVTAEAPARVRAVRVWFEPRARTAWHTHPLGQTLHVLAGVGRVQLKGRPAQEIRPGDTVWIAPGEVHWHGAAPGQTMVHLAIHEANDRGVQVEWLDHFTDQEYDAPLG